MRIQVCTSKFFLYNKGLSCHVRPEVNWRQVDVSRQVTWRRWRRCIRYNLIEICLIHFKFCVSSSSAPTGKMVCHSSHFLKKIIQKIQSDGRSDEIWDICTDVYVNLHVKFHVYICTYTCIYIYIYIYICRNIKTHEREIKELKIRFGFDDFMKIE